MHPIYIYIHCTSLAALPQHVRKSNLTFSINASKRTFVFAELKLNSFHRELKCGFCFVMIFHDYQAHIRRSTDWQICGMTENMPFHRKYVKGPISWTCDKSAVSDGLFQMPLVRGLLKDAHILICLLMYCCFSILMNHTNQYSEAW